MATTPPIIANLPGGISADETGPLDIHQALESSAGPQCSSQSHCSVSSLPHEMLVKIFWKLDLFGSPHKHTRPSEKCTLPFEILVSHVSRRWRDIALGTPAFWTQIHRRPMQNNLGSTFAYLARSAQTSIEITIQVVDDRHHQSYEFVGPFCELIQPHLPRCRRLDIFSSNQREDPTILRMLGSPNLSMHRLQTMKMKMNTTFMNRRLIHGGALMLEQLHLIGSAIEAPASHFNALATVHYDLSVAGLDWFNPINALNSMPHLAHLQLDIPEVTPWPSNLNKIAIETLNTLCVNTTTMLHVLFVVAQFNVPALQEIGVHVMANLSEVVSSSIVFGVPCRTQYPSLRKLCFSPPSEGASLVTMQLLTHIFSTVTHVTVRQKPGLSSQDPPHIFCMAPTSSLQHGRVPWPDLESLGVEGEWWLSDLQDFFVKRVEMEYPVPQLLLSAEKISQGQAGFSFTKPTIKIGCIVYDSPFLQQELIHE
ncbi:hypothetical protein FIBSPDRAFT_1043654 [Athelia psychrophila]|uniref:Uncharacterized protein n=1 Tax=Athelia psychrophila TaxID=1759441 RepID=A0A166KZ74_9AGAM|nr:hypothetical protein FIBSPDRAFT_1043654 [Fibularhizoctonia sp. CBS 109695]